MRFVQAQFSIKFEPLIRIRRFANDIEDYLQNHYGTPQTMPIPDEFAPEAPRIIMHSKNQHSQISFSQISADLNVRFDGSFITDFKKTQEYIQERILLIIDLLKKIGINDYLFCGISYNARLDIGDKTPIDYIKQYLGGIIPSEGLYEASQNIAIVKNNKFFINQQIGTYKEFQGMPGTLPNLFEIGNGALISEGISLTIDINNRYQYIYHKNKHSINDCAKDVEDIFLLFDENICQWE